MNRKVKLDAETKFATEIFNDRVAVNRKALAVLAEAGPSRQVTIRLSHAEIDRARRQAEGKGLKYQTYIKMLLHDALRRGEAERG